MYRYLVNYIYMFMINVHEAKAHLSRYLDLLAKGQRVLICRRNVPVAELRALPRAVGAARAFGEHRGEFSVPADFNAPLDDDELALWEGRGEK